MNGHTSQKTSRDQALELLSKVPLIDGHNDFPFMLRGLYGLNINGKDLEHIPLGQTSIQKLRDGRVGGQFWSAFVPCPVKSDEFSDDLYLSSLRDTLQQIDTIHNMIMEHPKTFALATSSKEVWDAFRSGRIASLIGVEGLHQIANSASVLRMYRRLGVRYVTLAHNSNTRYSDAATSRAPLHGGLSSDGRKMIEEMNRIGMMIDLSHTSEETQRQVLAISKAPVIFSHSSCAALCPHARNTSDEILEALKRNNGVIMICFLRELVSSTIAPPSLKDVVEHIIYAGQKIGFRHVGIGSDFDGMLEGPDGLDDTSHFVDLVTELFNRGVKEDDIKSVVGLNILRVMDQVDEVAALLQQPDTINPILVDKVPALWTEEEMDLLLKQGEIRRSNLQSNT